MTVSIIIPFYNERENLPLLLEKLEKNIRGRKETFEVILVDDGSDDDWKSVFSEDKLIKLIKEKNIKIISHRKRFGKGTALATGLAASKGQIIVFMDADLQNDPSDLGKFLEKINKGADFVNGIRIGRHKDNFILEIYSKGAAFFLKKFLHSPFIDINCGFKAFRREVLKNFVFYGGNFRFFPLAVFYQGFKVDEVKIIDHPRRYGVSKFGAKKLLGGIFDTLTAYFLYRFWEKPLHFFGFFGGSLFFVGFIILTILAIERIFFNILLYRRPILFLGILLVVVGVQIIMTGVIGELIVYLDKKRS